MNSRFGRCRNQDYCTLAVQNAVLRLGEDELFVCPECARPLVAAPAWGRGGIGRAALLRLLPPLGIAGVGLAAIVLGIQYSELPSAPVKHAAAPVAVAAARPLPHLAVAKSMPAPKAAPRPPVAAAPPAPPPETVLLSVAAAPPLNTMLMPQLAAGYLAIGRGAAQLIGTVGDAVHVALPADGRLLSVVIREVPAGNTQIPADADIFCTPGAAPVDLVKPARLTLAAMPAEPHEVITCSLSDAGPATEFALFLASAAAKQIVAEAGYLPPVPPAPPKPPVAKPPSAKQATPKTAVAKAAPDKSAATPKTAPKQAADDDSDTPAAPSSVKPPETAALTADVPKSMTLPDQLDGATHDDSNVTPKPRTVTLPPAAQISFAPYQGIKLPKQTLHMYSISATGTRAPGDVHADCKIGTDGIPTDCRQISHTGTQAEADAILAWLPSGGIRYTPKQKDGHPVAERRVLTVKFGGVKEGQGALPPGPPLRTSP